MLGSLKGEPRAGRTECSGGPSVGLSYFFAYACMCAKNSETCVVNHGAAKHSLSRVGGVKPLLCILLKSSRHRHTP